MAQQNLNGWHHQLQDRINPTDQEWVYAVPTLPRSLLLNPQRLLKSVTVTSNASKQSIDLRLSKTPINRALANEALDRFLSISFNDFRLYYPPNTALQSKDAQDATQHLQRAPSKESADYIIRLLRSGIVLNGVRYHFYGHSNSQLKSRTCVLFAGSKDEISGKIESFGDFASKTVAKKAKRIGLFFSTAEMAIELQPDRCEDFPDVVLKDYVFTDGCGLISRHLANLLVKQTRIQYRNKTYLPSVFQIRYRGYKGVLTLEPTLKGQILAKFRDSMKKFKGGTDISFSVVDYSKVPLLFIQCR